MLPSRAALSPSPVPPVAITGLGLVCPLGNDVPSALGRACRGESGIRAYASPWVDPAHPTLHRRVGGTVVDFAPDPALDPRLAARQEPAVLYAMTAAAEALAHAGLDDVDDRDVDRHRFGCVVGAGLPGAELWCLMAESGNSFCWTTHHLRFAEPGRYRLSSSFGSMGHATSGVVGAALARRGKAFAVVGDGAMMMLNEVHAAVQHRADAVWVVLNDAQYLMRAQGMWMMGWEPFSCALPPVDFVALARAIGAGGERVTREEDVGPALERAARARGPWIVDSRDRSARGAAVGPPQQEPHAAGLRRRREELTTTAFMKPHEQEHAMLSQQARQALEASRRALGALGAPAPARPRLTAVDAAADAPAADAPAAAAAGSAADPLPSELRASMHDAGQVKAPPWVALVVALASARPDGIGAAIDWLAAHRGELERAYDGGGAGKLDLASLPGELQYQPERGFLDLDRRDHALRDRYLFTDVVGQRTFFQTAVYAMTGLELPPRHAQLLEQLGNANLQADVRAWPLAVTRRIAAHGGGYAAAVTGGVAMMASHVLAGAAAADCARFLLRVDAAQAEGRLIPDVVTDVIARGERVMGFGRPAVPVDERVEKMHELMAAYGRDRQPYVTLLGEVAAAFFAQKGLRTSSAARAAAILLDFGLTPEQVHAVCNFWVSVCVYAQAVYAGERGVLAGDAARR